MLFTWEIDADTVDDKKQTTNTTYNHTEHGVDILDKMIGQYDAAINGRRWPLTLFIHIMSVTRTNQNYSDEVRNDFLQDLALDFMKPI